MPLPDWPVEAVALRYAEGDGAPHVVAKGRGMLADEIIRRARAAGIFVHASRDLTALLMQVDLDRRIPPALYVAIAELLAWVHRVERGQPHRPGPSGGPVQSGHSASDLGATTSLPVTQR